ncbi:MAG: ribonuclease HII, partial [Bradymonadia bacterium]
MQHVLDLKCNAAIGDVEKALIERGERWVIGVDEAGRGPLAGPVSVGAVI